MSKYENTLAELKAYIDGCKKHKLSGNILVNRSQIYEYLDQLQMETPQEIKKYQRIIGNRDAILNEAQEKSNKIVEEAIAEREKKIAEHEIMEQAYEQAQELINEASAQAQEILDSAVNDANDIRTSAMQYTDDILAELQQIISQTMDNVTNKYDGFMKAFSQKLDIITDNRKELVPDQGSEETDLSEDSNVTDDNSTDTSDGQDYENVSDTENYDTENYDSESYDTENYDSENYDTENYDTDNYGEESGYEDYTVNSDDSDDEPLE